MNVVSIGLILPIASVLWSCAPQRELASSARVAYDEQDWFGTFRLGIWPYFFPDVQFSRDPEALEQYFRQMTTDTGPLDPALNAEPVTALFEKIGPGILVTPSHSGGMGRRVAVQSSNVRAIVSYEPGSGFIFPEGKGLD